MPESLQSDTCISRVETVFPLQHAITYLFITYVYIKIKIPQNINQRIQFEIIDNILCNYIAITRIGNLIFHPYINSRITVL